MIPVPYPFLIAPCLAAYAVSGGVVLVLAVRDAWRLFTVRGRHAGGAR